MRRKERNKRFFTVCLCACMVFSTHVTPPVQAQAAARPLPPRNLFEDVTAIRIPAQIGEIQQFYRGHDDKMLILVQDAHSIPDAQNSIRALLSFFQSEYGVDLALLEGSTESYDPLIFRSFPDQNLLKKVFKSYLAGSELTGATAAAVFNKSEAIYEGIEDWDLYEQEIDYYLRALEAEENVQRDLNRFQERLMRAKRNTYSERLWQVDAMVQRFQNEEVNLIELLKLLQRFRAPVKGSKLESLVLAFASEEAESVISVLMEVKSIARKIERLFKSRKPSAGIMTDIEQFNRERQRFQVSERSPEQFGLYLYKLIKKYQFPIRVSDQLGRKVGHQKRVQDIRGTQLFDDLEIYIQRTKSDLFANEDERKLDRESRRLEIMDRLIRLELTQQDWVSLGDLMRERDEWTIEADGIVAGSELRALIDQLNAHIRFYEIAHERDLVFMRKAMTLMEKHRRDKAMIVAGGFHTEGLTRQFEKQGVSYILVRPQIDSIPDQHLYRQHMRGEVSWQDYFEVKGGKVSLHDAFVRGTRDRLLNESEERRGEILKRWRDQIIRNLANQGEIEKASQYVRFIDELNQRTDGGAESLRLEWFDAIDNFVDSLQGLQSGGRLTEANVINIMQTSRAAELALQVLTGQSASADLFRNIPAVRTQLLNQEPVRSEMRSLSSQDEGILKSFIEDKPLQRALNTGYERGRFLFPEQLDELRTAGNIAARLTSNQAEKFFNENPALMNGFFELLSLYTRIIEPEDGLFFLEFLNSLGKVEIEIKALETLQEIETAFKEQLQKKGDGARDHTILSPERETAVRKALADIETIFQEELSESLDRPGRLDDVSNFIKQIRVAGIAAKRINPDNTVLNQRLRSLTGKESLLEQMLARGRFNFLSLARAEQLVAAIQATYSQPIFKNKIPDHIIQQILGRAALHPGIRPYLLHAAVKLQLPDKDDMTLDELVDAVLYVEGIVRLIYPDDTIKRGEVERQLSRFAQLASFEEIFLPQAFNAFVSLPDEIKFILLDLFQPAGEEDIRNEIFTRFIKQLIHAPESEVSEDVRLYAVNHLIAAESAEDEDIRRGVEAALARLQKAQDITAKEALKGFSGLYHLRLNQQAVVMWLHQSDLPVAKNNKALNYYARNSLNARFAYDGDGAHAGLEYGMNLIERMDGESFVMAVAHEIMHTVLMYEADMRSFTNLNQKAIHEVFADVFALSFGLQQKWSIDDYVEQTDLYGRHQAAVNQKFKVDQEHVASGGQIIALVDGMQERGSWSGLLKSGLDLVLNHSEKERLKNNLGVFIEAAVRKYFNPGDVKLNEKYQNYEDGSTNTVVLVPAQRVTEIMNQARRSEMRVPDFKDFPHMTPEEFDEFEFKRGHDLKLENTPADVLNGRELLAYINSNQRTLNDYNGYPGKFVYFFRGVSYNEMIPDREAFRQVAHLSNALAAGEDILAAVTDGLGTIEEQVMREIFDKNLAFSYDKNHIVMHTSDRFSNAVDYSGGMRDGGVAVFKVPVKWLAENPPLIDTFYSRETGFLALPPDFLMDVIDQNDSPDAERTISLVAKDVLKQAADDGREIYRSAAAETDLQSNEIDAELFSRLRGAAFEYRYRFAAEGYIWVNNRRYVHQEWLETFFADIVAQDFAGTAADETLIREAAAGLAALLEVAPLSKIPQIMDGEVLDSILNAPSRAALMQQLRNLREQRQEQRIDQTPRSEQRVSEGMYKTLSELFTSQRLSKLAIAKRLPYYLLPVLIAFGLPDQAEAPAYFPVPAETQRFEPFNILNTASLDDQVRISLDDLGVTVLAPRHRQLVQEALMLIEKYDPQTAERIRGGDFLKFIGQREMHAAGQALAQPKGTIAFSPWFLEGADPAHLAIYIRHEFTHLVQQAMMIQIYTGDPALENEVEAYRDQLDFALAILEGSDANVDRANLKHVIERSEFILSQSFAGRKNTRGWIARYITADAAAENQMINIADKVFAGNKYAVYDFLIERVEKLSSAQEQVPLILNVEVTPENNIRIDYELNGEQASDESIPFKQRSEQRSAESLNSDQALMLAASVAPTGIRTQLQKLVDFGGELNPAAARQSIELARAGEFDTLRSRMKEAALTALLQSLDVKPAASVVNTQDELEAYRTAARNLMATLTVIGDRSFSIGLALPNELSAETPLIQELLKIMRAGEGQVSEIVFDGKLDTGTQAQFKDLGAYVRSLNYGRKPVLFNDQPAVPLLTLRNVKENLNPSFIPFQADLKGIDDQFVQAYVEMLRSVAAIHTADLISRDAALLLNPDQLKAALLTRLQYFGAAYDNILTRQGDGWVVMGTAARAQLEMEIARITAASA